MGIHIHDYRTIPTLTIEQAYVNCFNDIKRMNHIGLYGGKRLQDAEKDLHVLSNLLITHHLAQSGYNLAMLEGSKAFVNGNDSS